MLHKLRGMHFIWRYVFKTYFNIYFWQHHLMPRASNPVVTHHNWICNLSHFQVKPYLLIFDNGCQNLRMKGTLELYFNCFSGCTYPNNMGLGTKIESVTSVVIPYLLISDNGCLQPSWIWEWRVHWNVTLTSSLDAETLKTWV